MDKPRPGTPGKPEESKPEESKQENKQKQQPTQEQSVSTPKLSDRITVLAGGGFGTGKTFLSLTFPKVGYLGFESNGLDTLRSNPHLKKNLVEYEEFVPSKVESLKDMWKRFDDCIKTFHIMGKDKALETLVIDPVSMMSETRWMYIEEFEPQYGKSGNLDTMAMYGELRSWMHRTIARDIVSFPGNVIVTTHMMQESEETLDKMPDKSAPVVPNILGSYRNKIAGSFSAYIVLETEKKPGGQRRFYARCQPGNQMAARNRYGLPEIVDNISYQAIVEAIDKANQ